MIFALAGLAVLAVLLFRFWFSESGWFAVRELEANVEVQVRQTAALAQRNRVLAAEVMTMKEGNEIVESRARTDLGMVVEGETFYVVVDPPESGMVEPAAEVPQSTDAGVSLPAARSSTGPGRSWGASEPEERMP